MKKTSFISIALALLISCSPAPKMHTGYVNPFNGTTTLWDSDDLGYELSPNPEFRTVLTESGRRPAQGITRAWGAECYPGATLPFAMVQATPVTMFGSGSGYQYEDKDIYAFFHSSKGQWGLGHVPILPFTGEITASNYHSGYSHENESAKAGYYQVYLERYGINAEMTTTLRCAFHKFTYRKGDEKKLLLNLSRMNSMRAGQRWTFKQENDNSFSGSQGSGETIYFYATTNHKITGTDSIRNNNDRITIVNFANMKEPLELKIGFSFTSVEKAKKNLEAEIMNKSFAQIVKEADETWENLLSKIQVSGGTEKQKATFYSCLYRAMQWPALRSDFDFDYTESRDNVVNKGYHYYTSNNLWDTWQSKMPLIGMLEPEITNNVIRSDVERARFSGTLSSGFHGDFASSFVTGAYLRGLRDYDVDSAYHYMLRKATIPAQSRRGRQYLDEYIERGWIAENHVENPTIKTEEDEAKAAVSKTLEYAYSDYSVALLAKELGDIDNYNLLMQRSGNYKNLFDPSTGFMRGRLSNGDWVTPFDPAYPYYVFMYRESTGWQSTFFAPHDPMGLINLFPDKKVFEQKLDSLFTIPWGGYEADNFTGFFGQYCVGNQPSQQIAYLYYFIDKQEKCQEKLDIIMDKYYNMGKEGLAYAGMDDEGGLSAWYVLNAIGLYTFSPAEPKYIITVPIFDKVVFHLGKNPFTITKIGNGKKITNITYDGQKIDGYFISHDDLKRGKELVITTE